MTALARKNGNASGDKDVEIRSGMPLERRKRLFSIARKEFATHGFSRASLNRILAEAGMSKSSFYHFFDDKSALFLACLDEVVGEVVAIVTAIRPEELTARNYWEKARWVTRRIADMLLDHPDLAETGRMFYRSLADSASCPFIGDEAASPAGRIMHEIREWLSVMLKRGQEVGAVRADLDPSLLTELVLAGGMAVDNWALARWDALSGEERARLAATTLDIVRRLTAAGEATPLPHDTPLRIDERADARCPWSGQALAADKHPQNEG